jgi:hypothetical protein
MTAQFVSRISTALTRSPFDARDYQFSDVMGMLTPVASLPASLNLSNGSAIWDQGLVDACVSYASAYMREYQAVIQQGIAYRLSPLFIYSQRPNYPANGMNSRDACTLLLNVGLCPDSVFPEPYNDALDGPFTAAQLELMLSTAATFRIHAYYAIATVDEVKVCLYEIHPFQAHVKHRTGCLLWRIPSSRPILAAITFKYIKDIKSRATCARIPPPS